MSVWSPWVCVDTEVEVVFTWWGKQKMYDPVTVERHRGRTASSLVCWSPTPPLRRIQGICSNQVAYRGVTWPVPLPCLAIQLYYPCQHRLMVALVSWFVIRTQGVGNGTVLAAYSKRGTRVIPTPPHPQCSIALQYVAAGVQELPAPIPRVTATNLTIPAGRG